jgi:hypothetical protein
MLACTHPALDGPVILFKDVIKILHRSMSTLLFQNTAGFEFNDGWRITSVLVGVDDRRSGMVLPAQGCGQKALVGRCIAFGREKEVDRRTVGVHGPVQVHPFAFQPHVRLVHPPRVVRRIEVLAQVPLQFPGRTAGPSARQ